VSRARQARRKETKKERELTEQAVERARTSGRRSAVRISRGGLAAVAVALAGVLVATGVRDVAGSSAQPSSARVEKELSAVLSGIPQSGDTLGQPSAPITLQVFGDLESADVRTFAVWLLPDIIREWVRTNIVKIQYRSFMTASSPYPNVFVRQQAAALAAGVQDRLWNFIETFYHEQGQEHTRYVTETYLDGIAGHVPGLELSEWERDREHSQLTRQVAADDHTARAMRFPDAPVFLIGRTGRKLTPWPGYRLYEEPGLKPGFIKRPVHPVSFMTSKILRTVIAHLP
jgi:protein-disulfide isomerase